MGETEALDKLIEDLEIARIKRHLSNGDYAGGAGYIGPVYSQFKSKKMKPSRKMLRSFVLAYPELAAPVTSYWLAINPAAVEAAA